MSRSDLAATRVELQRIATHVLCRRRHDVSGRFGLRPTPGGLGTPAFGDPDALEVVRLNGTHLIHEVGPEVRALALEGATLAELARFVGVDLALPLSVGRDTVDLGDPEAPLQIDPPSVGLLADWLHLGWQALDAVTSVAPEPALVQLWPEHFDAGTAVAVGPHPDDRVNLGASLGDHHVDEPYLYVAPWGAERPGDESYWNVTFGAALPRSAVDSLGAAVDFFRRGLRHFD